MNDFYEKFTNRNHFDSHVQAISKHLDEKCKSEEITVSHEIFSADLHLNV
jgi:hypothetical protein